MRGAHDRSADRHRRTPRQPHPAARERRVGRRASRRSARRCRPRAVVVALRGDMPDPGGSRCATGSPSPCRSPSGSTPGARRPTRGSGACSSSAASCGRSSPSARRPSRRALQRRARRGLGLRGGDRLPPARLPVRAAARAAPTGRSCWRGRALIGLLYVPTALLVDAVPGAVHVGHLHHRLPGERAEPRRRDARVGERRRDPGARGALDPAPAAGPLATRGPAHARDAAHAARARAGPRRARCLRMFTLAASIAARRAGVDDDGAGAG